MSCPTIGPVHIPDVKPADCGPASTNATSSARCVGLNLGAAPGALRDRSPSAPFVSYQRSHVLIAERQTPSSSTRTVTFFPSM